MMRFTRKPYQGVVSKRGTPEHDLQCSCVSWFRYQFPQYAPLLFAVPNGGSRRIVEAQRLKAEGVLSGVSDLIFLAPSGKPLLIEMKTSAGRQSPEQKIWQKDVEDAGYTYVIARSLDEFIEIVKNHLMT